ncbi:ribosomal RNA large subunit methyltransferase H [mine drainage metagenome]|uniref:Ribosomal RNA large subunit methyltransferase H n=1 Tax=mine drainage metagenome TaxID=410659 RepID=A0A1J5RN38_9ZZZZ
MRLLIVAVGTRMPDWVEAGYAGFAKRMPPEMPLQLVEVKAEPRTLGKPLAALLAAEAARLRAALPARCHLVALDEHGSDVDTRGLSARLEKWQAGGSDVALIIGGPDGLDPALKQAAAESLRLSSLTLPHALVRVLLAEALYRAISLQKGHPYHRQ